MLPDLFMNGAQDLARSLKFYADYLSKSSEKMSQNRENPESPRTIENSFTLSLPYEKTEKKILPQFRKLNEVVSGLSDFEPICLDKDMLDLDITGDRRRRFEWIKQIKISYRCSYEICYSTILILKTFYVIN